jgi:hypothetical protein
VPQLFRPKDIHPAVDDETDENNAEHEQWDC